MYVLMSLSHILHQAIAAKLAGHVNHLCAIDAVMCQQTLTSLSESIPNNNRLCWLSKKMGCWGLCWVSFAQQNMDTVAAPGKIVGTLFLPY